MARPRTIDSEQIASDMLDYINSKEFPIIAEFLSSYRYNRDTLYRLAKESDTLSDCIKDMHNKAEAYLVRESIAGNIPSIPAIFMLKQRNHGYTDKQEVTSTNVNINAEDLTEEEAKKILQAAGIEI